MIGSVRTTTSVEPQLVNANEDVLLTKVVANEVDGSEWDAVVIGAGTGGTTAAIQLSRQGKRVLLVEAKAFPRDKVCGGCLNQRAWIGLQQIGYSNQSAEQRVQAAGAVAIDRMRLNCMGQTARWNLPRMHAISRRRLDCILVRMAIEAGVVFCGNSPAKVVADEAQYFRSIQLGKAGASTATVRARVVIAADGLGHPSLSELEHHIGNQVATHARIGVGTILADCDPEYLGSTLTMAVGRSGYVGLACVEGKQLNVAAAIDSDALKSLGPPKAVEQILKQCHLPLPNSLHETKWTGTLPLTRRSRRVAARRLFLIGDATSYIEPFTGEGMSWSISDALQLSRLLERADTDQCDELSLAWMRQWKNGVGYKRWVCRGLAELLRYPSLASCSLVVARSLPWIPQWLITRASGAVRIGAA